MAKALRRKLVRSVSAGSAAAALLAACGGGELIAILQIVTPLAGAWQGKGGNESINFGSPANDDQVFSSKIDVTANLTSASGVCGDKGNTIELVGRLDNGKLTLRRPGEQSDCLKGRFVNLRQLDIEANGDVPPLSYFNDRVEVRMGAGLWASENGRVKLKFNGPETVNNRFGDGDTAAFSGCDVSDPVAKVAFKGTLFGFNTSTGAKPSIPELLKTSDNSKLFTGVEYVDGDSITLRNAAGETVSLTRKNESASCS